MNQFVFAAAQGAAQSRPRSRRATRACRCLGLDGLYPFLLVAGGLATALCSYCGDVAAVCGAHGCGLHVRVSMRLGCALVVVWALVFAAASGARFSLGWSALPLLLFETFYRIGSTIFGGGQVVLPMLLTQVVGPGWVSETAFYAGMALTQSLPGPLFNFAAYLGTVAGGVGGGLCAVAGLFGPGCVLILAVSPFWLRARESPLLQAATTGVNAAAAGLVVAACVTLTFGAVKCPADAAVALAVAGLSSVLGVSAPKSVGIGGALGALLAYAGVARVPYHA